MKCTIQVGHWSNGLAERSEERRRKYTGCRKGQDGIGWSHSHTHTHTHTHTLSLWAFCRCVWWCVCVSLCLSVRLPLLELPGSGTRRGQTGEPNNADEAVKRGSARAARLPGCCSRCPPRRPLGEGIHHRAIIGRAVSPFLKKGGTARHPQQAKDDVRSSCGAPSVFSR